MNNAVDNIVMTTSFEKGIKRLKKNHQSDVIADIRDIVKKLAKFEITTQLSNHPLTNSNGQKDIHIRPNIILLYKYTDNGKLLISLELHDIVSHDQLYSQNRKKKFKKSDFKKYHEDINETVKESPKEMSYAYIGNFYVNGVDGDINIGRDSVEVKDIDRRSAINKIIRKFKSTHISFLTAVHNGWRTNVFIDEDKVVENPTDKSLFELEKEYEEENSKEKNVDDPKYNYDDKDREGNYKVESLDYGSAEYKLNRLDESAYLKQKSSYMVNKDGKVIFVDIMHPYLRQFGFDGETIQEAFQNIFDESETDLSAIRWYYNNTNSEEVKNDIRVLLFNVYRFSKKYPDKIFFNLTKSIVTEFNLSNDLTKLNTFKDVLNLFEKIDNNLNDEFMKVRTSGKYDDNGLDGDIYFRISSNDFDWFDIIYDIVHSNKSWIKYVTIATDHQSPLKNYADVYYKTRDGQLINRMMIDEFLSIEKDPVIESIDSGSAIYELNRLDESLKEQTAYMLKYDGNAFEVPKHQYILLNGKINGLLFGTEGMDWFYDNTSDEFAKSIIRSIVNSTKSSLRGREKYELLDNETPFLHEDDIVDSIRYMQNELDQEFCRVRMSDSHFKGSGKSIYFRISSVGFDWFDTIWFFVNKCKQDISDVSIVTDDQSTKTDKEIYYKTRDGQEIKNIPTDEFLALEKSPIIEEFRSVREMFNHCNLYNTNWLFESAREDLGAGCSAKELSESIAKSQEIVKNFDKEKFIERMKSRYNIK